MKYLSFSFSRRRKGKKELEKEIIIFQEKVGEVKVLASDGQILEEAEFYDPVIQQCEELKEKTNELEDWAKAIARNQAMFAVPSQRFSELDDFSIIKFSICFTLS